MNGVYRLITAQINRRAAEQCSYDPVGNRLTGPEQGRCWISLEWNISCSKGGGHKKGRPVGRPWYINPPQPSLIKGGSSETVDIPP